MKAPQLKMPEAKAPAFLADLYYDLRDRRLLPLVALIVVAIAAVPFLLGGDSEEFEAPAEGGVIAGLDSAKERAATLSVVEATPGLRDYRKRLSERTPTDPFERHFSSGSLKGAQLNEGKGGGEAKGETSSKSSTDGSGSGSGEGSGGGSGGGAPTDGGASPGTTPPPADSPPKGSGGGEGELTFYAFAVNVRIVKSVGGQRSEPIVRERVLPQTGLPGEKEPVVTYMGVGREGKKSTGKALMLVAENVVSVEGDANCVSGDEICQLLEVEPGFPVVLTLDSGARYSVNVLKLGLIVTGHG